jgi:DNA mismatch repair protein MutS
MCGVPHHSASSYIAKLIQEGHKVAICEQVEDPKQAKGLVRREVVRVVTPGLILDPETLISGENNHLMGICPQGEAFGIAVLDLSTGEFRVTEVSGERALLFEGERIRPSELLLPEDARGREDLSRCLAAWKPAMVSFLSPEAFQWERAQDALTEQFQVPSLDGLGCGEMAGGIRAAGAVLAYARETQGPRLSHIRTLLPYRLGDHMVLDDWTRRNLELFENLQDRGRRGSLISILDRTLTPMGARKLKRWLSYPLVDPERIEKRLEAVGELVGRGETRDALREGLKGIQDLERLMGRISMGTAHARDLLALKESLRGLPPLRGSMAPLRSRLAVEILEGLDPLEDVALWIQETLVDAPPMGLREGGLIREGVHPQLDEWIRMSREGKGTIAGMEASERERTGISTLRVGYNKVFGYYIEVTKAHAKSVPPEYVRKQTLLNAERYINEELKEYELRVTGAEEKRVALEYELFVGLRERVAGEAHRIQQVAERLAELDALVSLAHAAGENRYVRPLVDPGDGLWIKDGRHPVVEKMPLQERFVPNDLEMDPAATRLIILTGPNMAGKSTYLRQTALIVLMAQMGSFVPASEARIGVVDRIFTRVGAMDNLSRGQSTFMVEMNETAQILHNATPRSLIVLDEIGRGTSTFDGLSIAWAVAEFILENPGIQAKTLFATHYHELTELALTRERVRNAHMAVKEWNERVIFLRRVVEGGTSRSYGIQVARLAGLPEEVIQRAQEILANLEKGELDEVGQPRLATTSRRQRARAMDPRQLTLFGGGEGAWLKEQIRKVDLETLTPIEALNLLHRWKQNLQDSG